MKVSALIRSVTFWITASLVIGGCALNRKGELGCPDDGQIACSVHKIDYKFTTLANRYQFDGSCTLYDDESKGKLGNPRLDFVAKGEYLKTTKRFLENVEVDSKNHPLNDDNHESWSMSGVAPLDPWLNPKSIVVVTHIWGNPKAFADGLCLEEIPKPYRQLPFSRNVVLHQMDVKEKLQMQIDAAYPEEPKIRFPSASACNIERQKAAPVFVLPEPGVVMQLNDSGVAVELRSECGAKFVDYAQSSYEVRFERFVAAVGWQPLDSATIPMTSSDGGGSSGFGLVPLSAQGRLRVKARQIMGLKNSASEAVTGSWSEWVEIELTNGSGMSAELVKGLQLRLKVENMKAPQSLEGLTLPKVRSLSPLARPRPESDSLPPTPTTRQSPVRVGPLQKNTGAPD